MDDETIDLGIEGLHDAVLVGRGGFGSVYRANQPDFRRIVAVKVLTAPETDLVARSRFERECKAMGSLSGHPHIVTLYGAGFLDDGRAYLVMAFMEGGSLGDRARDGAYRSWQDVATIGTKLAGALETAHRAGILHRDLKPANVLVSAYGEPQLTDFGIARIAGGHETTDAHVTASLPYAPPEILDGQPPSPVSDVYSLAATLVHLLTGTAPFTTDDDSGFAPLLRRIYEDEPTDLQALGVPAPFAAVLRTAMAKDPSLRPRSAEELGRQIRQVQADLGVPPGEMAIAGAPPPPAPNPNPPTRPIPSAPAPPAPTAPPASPPAPPAPTDSPPAPAPAPPPAAAPTASPPAPAPAPPAPTPAAPTPPPAAAPSAVAPPGAGSERNHSRALFGLAAAALVVALGVFGVMQRSGGEADETTTTATTAPVEPTATTSPTTEPTATTSPTNSPTTQPTPGPTPSTGGPIVLGGSASGTLAAGEFGRYTFDARAGDIVTFEVASADANPRVAFLTPGGIPVVGANDCAVLTSPTDARLVTQVAVSGEHAVTIDLLDGPGSYTLTTSTGGQASLGDVDFIDIRARPALGFQSLWVAGDGDLAVVVRSADGRIISTDDDCFGNRNARLDAFLADPDGSITVSAYSTVPPSTIIGLFGIEGFVADGVMPAATRATFALDLTAGQQLDVVMRSTDADAFVAITDPADTVLANDDDSGEGLDAQLSYVAPFTGRFRIATSFIGDGAGSFTLEATIR